jgi:hypothetical protein
MGRQYLMKLFAMHIAQGYLGLMPDIIYINELGDGIGQYLVHINSHT